MLALTSIFCLITLLRIIDSVSFKKHHVMMGNTTAEKSQVL